MSQADFLSPRRTRIGVAIVVVLLHVAAILGLIRAFAPDFSAQVTQQVISAFTVDVTATPPPPPDPSPKPATSRAPESVDAAAAAAAAAAGFRANPREAAAPPPRIVLAEQPAPPIAATGTVNASGAQASGAGTGAGGQGTGTGSGAGGSGQGGGGGPGKAAKIAGDINSARDYPRASRALRIGSEVIVELVIGADGKVGGCSVRSPSRDPAADRITCRLATQRFRFRPATDASGNPIASTYGWRQRWFDLPPASAD